MELQASKEELLAINEELKATTNALEESNDELQIALGKAEEGLDELTEDHWAVINYIRGYYLEKELAPMVRKMCKHTGLKLKYIFELFPSGPAKGACKLAGLPKPDGCV